MTDDDFDTLMGIFAYDNGCVDSGIHDEGARQRLKDTIKSWTDEEFRLAMSARVRDEFLSDEAIAKGYGLEDVAEFIRWLGDRMGIDL